MTRRQGFWMRSSLAKSLAWGCTAGRRRRCVPRCVCLKAVQSLCKTLRKPTRRSEQVRRPPFGRILISNIVTSGWTSCPPLSPSPCPTRTSPPLLASAAACQPGRQAASFAGGRCAHPLVCGRCPIRLQAARVLAGVLRPALRADVRQVLRAPWGPGPRGPLAKPRCTVLFGHRLRWLRPVLRPVC
jgi:hypothetical protein